MTEPAKKIIYDFGSNNGDDIPYYLMKADIVVAVEANPALTAQIERRFEREIAEGQLFVENCVLTADEQSNEVPFYIHRSDPVFSQFPEPPRETIASYRKVSLPAKSAVSIIHAHGDPLYIKIDIEHYDEVILEQLFRHGVRPPFISAESHTIEVFSAMVTLGKYRSFNLVDGTTVSDRYRSSTINSMRGKKTYSFPHDSAGPFGEDIDGPWMTPNNFFRSLAIHGLGWKDIHATTLISPDPTVLSFRFHLQRALSRKIARFFAGSTRRRRVN